MRRLLLLRHAKSDWTANLPDPQRQLNNRGRKAAAVMGQHIQDEGLTPGKVLCSPAMRAAETWRLVRPSLTPAPDAATIDEIYDAGSGTAMLGIIRQHGGNAQTVMLIGHNPSLEDLALLLSGTGGPNALENLARKFPSAALAVIDFEFDDWRNIAPSKGILHSFTRPKDLTG